MDELQWKLSELSKQQFAVGRFGVVDANVEREREGEVASTLLSM